mmetsp:Transcript_178255/g.433682  ORF Transcript_178255/g.433682 Transcript_178255/m.433682 type:complete len:520 (-) Transcript_178255:94-1653(-)
MHKYRLISKEGEGTFSEVLKAQSIKSGKYTAIKCMKNRFDSIDQVNNLREIQALRRLAGHPNIIKLHEVLYDEPTGRLALVFELMDMNLYEAIKGRRHYLPEHKVKQYMHELMKALDHMHRNGIFHRDVKPENLLLLDDEIKLADLGSCRGIYSRQPYTEYISTRWYRAPECLLTDGYYNFKMDLFAAGCVWFETVALFPLFPGQNEMDQIQKIHNVLGTPEPEFLARKFKRNASHMDFNFPEKKGSGIERLLPHADPDLVELMKKLIRYDPDERILARQVLKDAYFRDFAEGEKERTGGSAPTLQGGLGRRGSSKLRDAPEKEGMSASSSTASIGRSHTPEVTRVSSQPHTPSGDERGGGLPVIRQERHRTPPGGGEGEELEDSMLLPPIGGGGGKSHKVKASSLKGGASGALQKPGLSLHGAASQSSHPLGAALGGSKGTGAASMSSVSASTMGHTASHPWVPARAGQEPTRNTMGSRGASGAADKMSSTWGPSQQARKDVTPFGGHKAPRESSKKR